MNFIGRVGFMTSDNYNNLPSRLVLGEKSGKFTEGATMVCLMHF